LQERRGAQERRYRIPGQPQCRPQALRLDQVGGPNPREGRSGETSVRVTTLAVGVTYGIAAYIVLPRAIRMGLKILQSKRVPSYTITGDGLPGDPVNVVLVGTLQQLRGAFAALGWSEADRLSLASSWGMVRAFVLNTPYPTAPFSTLYLFGRGQDIGFQKAIDNSPRKRHHIRFWALSQKRARATW